MRIIGITGGVGAGKSRILGLISKREDAYIVEADKLAHSLMRKGCIIYEAIIKEFGDEILGEDLEIDRKKLGEIVFNDDSKLEKLNEISHPLVKQEILRQILEMRTQKKYFVIEAALLLQDGYRSICDDIWFIRTDNDIRIDRIMKQRGYSLEKCHGIIASQPDDDYYADGSDYIIDNNEDFEETKRAVDLIFDSYEQ